MNHSTRERLAHVHHHALMRWDRRETCYGELLDAVLDDLAVHPLVLAAWCLVSRLRQQMEVSA